MKKFLYTLFCILIITIITSVYLPQKASASNPEIQKVVLIKAVKDINNKWEWMFQLTTQNADGYYIRIDINKIQNGQSTKIKTVDVGQPIVLNQITVLTGSILDDKTTYIVYFTVFNGENNIPYPNSMKFYSDTTGKAVSQPIITSFTPTEGKDGDSVTIIGSGFTGARKVFINDTEMTNLSVENDNKIVATIAEGTKSGKILVNFYMNSVISQNSFNIKTDPVDVTGENDPSVVNKDIYTPLAPIGNLNQVKTTDVGTYLNIIFKIAIGLCAVLAVIMIVIGGVSYMGNESVFGKTEAKSRITAAILGLIIALGAYALLNTIDPNLLGKNGVKIDQVSAEIDEAPILSDINTSVPSGASNSFPHCKGGVRKTAVATKDGYMTFCSMYSSKLQQLISDAYHSNPSIVLSGGAFRDAASQIAARKRNCADAYNTPPNQCKPPTAKPGTSAHENGLAVDFTCDGNLINWQTNKNASDYQPKYTINQNTKKCFDWLNTNASKYGFKNYSRENWHWSTGELAGK